MIDFIAEKRAAAIERRMSKTAVEEAAAAEIRRLQETIEGEEPRDHSCTGSEDESLKLGPTDEEEEDEEDEDEEDDEDEEQQQEPDVEEDIDSELENRRG